MNDTLVLEARGLGYDYYNHKIFQLLSDLESFYNFLSYNCSNKCNGLLLTNILSIDSSIYSSMEGSIESIRTLVYIGRLNDAFTLVRKYYDATLTDTYKSILIKDEESTIFKNNIDIKNVWSKSIVRAWTYSNKHLYDLPSGKRNNPNKDIRTRKDVLNSLEQFDLDLYRIIDKIKNPSKKKTCNDNVHYNSWENFVLNQNDQYDGEHLKLKALDDLYENIQISLCFHFSYICILHPEYIASSDYLDALGSGITPEENSQYWVAPIVQNIFESYIKPYSKDLSDYLININTMNLK